MPTDKMLVEVEFEEKPSKNWVGYVMFVDTDRIKMFFRVDSRLQFMRVLKENAYRIDHDSTERAKNLFKVKGSRLAYATTIPRTAPLLNDEAERAGQELLERLEATRIRNSHEELGVIFAPPLEIEG